MKFADWINAVDVHLRLATSQRFQIEEFVGVANLTLLYLKGESPEAATLALIPTCIEWIEKEQKQEERGKEE